MAADVEVQSELDRDPAPDRSLSAILREMAGAAGDRLTIGEMIDRFESRAFGAVLFAFAVPNLLPLPPGSSTVLGAPLVLTAPQVAMGRPSPWTPSGVRRRSVSRNAMASIFSRLIGPLERIETFSRPRISWLFGPVGDRLIGAMCTALALVLILPIPFGNMLPAAAIGALSLSLVLRDGVIALVGYLLTAASGLVLFLTGHVVLSTLRRLLEAFAV